MRKPQFHLRPIRVGFVVDRAVLHSFSPNTWFIPDNAFPAMRYTPSFIHHRYCIISEIGSVVTGAPPYFSLEGRGRWDDPEAMDSFILEVM